MLQSHVHGTHIFSICSFPGTHHWSRHHVTDSSSNRNLAFQAGRMSCIKGVAQAKSLSEYHTAKLCPVAPLGCKHCVHTCIILHLYLIHNKSYV